MGRVRLWDVGAGTARQGWKAHDGAVTGLGFLESGTRVLSGGWDGDIAIWTLDGRAIARRKTSSPVTALAVEESVATAVTGHADGSLRLWQIPGLNMDRAMTLHDGRVRAVALHGASGWFASSDHDTRVLLWTRDGLSRDLPAPPTDARTLVFHPRGDRLYGAGWFDLVYWSIPDGNRTVLETEHRGIINSMMFSKNGMSLATISRETDSAVLILDPESGVTRNRLQKHELCGAAVATSADGRVVVTTSDDGSVRFWTLPVHPVPGQLAPRNAGDSSFPSTKGSR